MTDKLTVTYTIPAGRVPAFETVVGKANKKAAKLGVGGFTWRVTGEAPAVLVRYSPPPGDPGRDWFGYVPAAEFTETLGTEVGASTLFDVEVTGTEPALDGWRFLASVDHDEAGNLVNVVPGADVEAGFVATWREGDADCDHCGLNRNRKKTYLLGKDGEVRRVGSTCIKDYFPGYATADAMARLADLWSVIEGAADDDGEEHYGHGGRFDGWRTETVLERTAAVVREVGWLSKSKARELGREGDATAYRVRDALTWRPSPGDREEPFPVTDADVDTAGLVFDWADSLEPGPTDDYLWNLTTAVARPVTSTRTLALVASAVGAWNREIARAAERATERWVDVPDDGARRTVRGKVLSVREDDGFYGPVTKGLILVGTPDGNFKLWGNLPGALRGAEVGDTVEFTAALTRSDRDSNFGFWKRPTKARFVDTVKAAKAA